jgi:hypothetical protein
MPQEAASAKHGLESHQEIVECQPPWAPNAFQVAEVLRNGSVPLAFGKVCILSCVRRAG